MPAVRNRKSKPDAMPASRMLREALTTKKAMSASTPASTMACQKMSRTFFWRRNASMMLLPGGEAARDDRFRYTPTLIGTAR